MWRHHLRDYEGKQKTATILVYKIGAFRHPESAPGAFFDLAYSSQSAVQGGVNAPPRPPPNENLRTVKRGTDCGMDSFVLLLTQARNRMSKKGFTAAASL